MKLEETRARVAQRVRQAIEGSDIAFSTAQRGQLDALTAEITDNVLIEFDALLNQAAYPAGPAAAAAPAAPAAAGVAVANAVAAAQPAAGGAEQVLWEGRPFLSIGERYVVTTERVRIISGLVGKDHEDIELVRVQDVDHKQGVGERILNIGDIFLHSSDPSEGDFVLRNVTNPEEVHEIVRRAVLDARRKYPFIYEQRM